MVVVMMIMLMQVGRQADNTATPVIKLDLCKQYVN